MGILLVIGLAFYLQAFLSVLVASAANRKLDIRAAVIAVMITPLAQMAIGLLVIGVLGMGMNTYAAVFGAGFALLMVGTVVALLPGFFIAPWLYRQTARKSQRHADAKSEAPHNKLDREI